MLLADRIRYHDNEIKRLRAEQIARVQEAATARELSWRGLGKLVGVREIRDWSSASWNPPQDLLDALDAALIDTPAVHREPLVSIAFDNADLLTETAPRNALATEIWREFGGVWSETTAIRLHEAGALRQSTIITDTRDGFFVDSRQDDYNIWANSRSNSGVHLFDRPDKAFNEFVYNRIVRPLSNRQPFHDRCWGWSEMCGRNLRYIATLLPFSTRSGYPPDRLVSIVTSDRGTSPAFDAE